MMMSKKASAKLINYLDNTSISPCFFIFLH